MKKFRFFIFGYRDQYFWSEYGPIVRDLMICKSLSEFNFVDRIIFFNRPVSLYERILRRKTRKMSNSLETGSDNMIFFDTTSFDIFGPLTKRLWCENIYQDSYSADVEMDKDFVNIVIDFLPIGKLPKWTEKANLIWYDLIDNFEKHNRYTEKEKLAVSKKYNSVRKLPHNKSIITGVSKQAIKNFENSILLENGILNSDNNNFLTQTAPTYDFGFMGFITNKFDVNKIKILSELGFSSAIYGEFYDDNTKKAVMNIPNVSVFGKFSNQETDQILQTFRVGLIPYIPELLHDESPLKMFQYLAAKKLVLSCSNFNQENSLLFVYSQLNFAEMAKNAIQVVQSDEFEALCSSSDRNFYWKNRLKDLLTSVNLKCQ